MSRTRAAAGNVLLLNLETDAGHELADILTRSSFQVCHWNTPDRECPDASALGERLRFLDPDVICFSAGPGGYGRLLGALREGKIRVPALAVSLAGEVSNWLDAIEAGAWDYFWGPFVPEHVKHVIENAIKCESHAGAAFQGLTSRN
jgi:DNA-binding response OmpR family regulator